MKLFLLEAWRNYHFLCKKMDLSQFTPTNENQTILLEKSNLTLKVENYLTKREGNWKFKLFGSKDNLIFVQRFKSPEKTMLGVTKKQIFHNFFYNLTQRTHELLQYISGYHKQELVHFERHKYKELQIVQNTRKRRN